MAELYEWLAIALAIVLLGVFALVFFQSDIRRLLSQLEKGPFGLRFRQPPPPQEPVEDAAQVVGVAPPRETVAPTAVRRPNITNSSAYIAEIEQKLLADLEGKNLPDAATREASLANTAAFALAGFAFEQISGRIWRSQLLALREINGRSGNITRAAIEPYYAEAMEKWAGLMGNVTFDQWLGFLFQSVLVLQFASFGGSR